MIELDPHHVGRVAYGNKLNLASNPYARHTKEHAAWQRGWLAEQKHQLSKGGLVP